MDRYWIADRLREPSTWRGLAVLLGAAGVAVNPELLQHIGAAVAGLIGAIEIVRREP